MSLYFELHKGQHPGWLSDENRPAWLGDEDMCEPSYRLNDWLGAYRKAGWWSFWNEYTSLRLKPPYWAIPALEAGYRPWAGGDEAPKDYAPGCKIMMRDGSTDDETDWSEGIYWGNNGRLTDTIGYMPATPKPDTGKTYPPELVERMVELARSASEMKHHNWGYVRDGAEVIMAEIDPPQVDPLVEAMREIGMLTYSDYRAEALRAELAKRGFQITEISS